MRKLLVAVLALGLMASVKATSYAYTAISTTTFSGTVTFTGTGSVSMSVAWNTGAAMQFTGITIGTTKWKAADNWLVVSSTMTDATGGIQITTNNRITSAVPRFTGATSANAAGLVNASNTTQALPMCWRVLSATGTVPTPSIVQGTDNSLYDTLYGGMAGSYPCYLWMMDKSSTGFTDGMAYAQVRSAINGIQQAEDTWLMVGPTVRVYLGADFTNAMMSPGGTQYATNTLTINAYRQ